MFKVEFEIIHILIFQCNDSLLLYPQLFPTIIVNLAALSSGMGYGFSAIALPQLKEVATNTFGRNEFARSYYQPFTIDDETGSWIGT